jgi:hypothetical protein
MDVNLLIKEKKISNLFDSFDSIRDELLNITLPLKRNFDKKGREKKALLNKANDLTLEVENMMNSLNEKKDIDSIKIFTKRVKEIIEEKEKIESQLLAFKD